mmetsp:Transcript_8452/g.18926  ORF Transcript_8452/g.18926 Transcript_8452/m.18926 type:complete len:110 (-) Transcript_8452:840-1169(-)
MVNSSNGPSCKDVRSADLSALIADGICIASASSLEEVLSVISVLIGPVGVYVSNHGGNVACGTVACTVVVVCSVLRCAQLRLVLLEPPPPWPGHVVEAQPVVRTVGARV